MPPPLDFLHKAVETNIQRGHSGRNSESEVAREKQLLMKQLLMERGVARALHSRANSECKTYIAPALHVLRIKISLFTRNDI